ncbi:hypothetical protein KIW84_050826 [Lathyrus oleraceus]|uniref:RRM domain-containing protein n=1 Tax=Pisum sativum TaxID=3888 RepID=A0A9D4WKS2_PEA|nr:hypothetical protein KIW84_050826 [Pisum sativum]
MPIHSSNHSLTSYTTVVVVVLLLFLQTSTPIIKALAENSHVTNFQSPNLYPKSLAWDPLKQHFLVGSLRHRTISSISDAGIIENLISDTSLPKNVTVVGITVDSRNNRVVAVIHAVKPLSPFNALAAYDLKSGNRLFLSPLPTNEEALANNVAVDYNDNAYVTNSIGNYIWKVNVKGEASIFSKSPRFTEHPVDRDTPYSYIGLNGIAYVSSGDYLLVVQSNTGKVFKVDADDGTARHVLLNEDLTRPDGVVFRSDGVVLVVSPQANKLWLLKSNNGWKEGVVYDKIDLASEGYPTSVVSRGRDKISDCLKVQFCHSDGDLFTLLSVYKEWEALPQERRNKWCWENSINAKSMRRCQDTVFELESFLEREHGFVVPSYWRWDPHTPSVHDKNMKKVILASLSENVAMFFGRNQLGYEVAQTGQHVQLHPSSSLLVFAQKPSWVVFGDLLSVSNEYLVCVSAVEFQSLYDLQPPPSFDVSKMEERKLQTKTLTGFGTILLKRFCGKSNSNLLGHVSRIRKACLDERIFVEVKVDENLIQLYAASHDMNTATMLVSDVLEYEKKRLRTECMEKCLYHGSGSASPMALFGSGAEIKHLELEKHSLSVDVYHSNINAIDDKELLMFFEKNTSGSICAVYKFQGMGKDPPDREKWGKITFLSPDAAKRAVELDGDEFCGSNLKILPSQSAMGGDKTFLFPEVKARIFWPRRLSRGFGIVICDKNDVNIEWYTPLSP